MHDGMIRDHQRMLFSKGMAWEQLPREVREEVSSMLTTVCIEIVLRIQETNQEQNHESSRD